MNYLEFLDLDRKDYNKSFSLNDTSLNRINEYLNKKTYTIEEEIERVKIVIEKILKDKGCVHLKVDSYEDKKKNNLFTSIKVNFKPREFDEVIGRKVSRGKTKDLKIINQIVRMSKYKSYFKKTLLEGKDEEKTKKKLDKEFLTHSYFGGICASLAIQTILEDKMEPNSHVRSLQRYLGLFALEIGRKNSVKDLKGMKFQDNFSIEVIEKFKEFLNENFGIDIAAVNGDIDREIFNDTITKEDIKKDLFKEDHNLIVLSEEDGLLKNTHVIYFNPQKREIADGVDGRIISIPKVYNEIEFLKAYLSEYYSSKSITVLSIEKQTNASKDIKFSSLEKIILWILRYWNLILHTIEKNFYKENLEYKYYELKDITEEGEKNLEDNLSGEIKSKDGKTVKYEATPDDENNLSIIFSSEDGDISNIMGGYTKGAKVEVLDLDKKLKNGELMKKLTEENGSAQKLFNFLFDYNQSLKKQKILNKELKLSLSFPALFN